MNKPSLPSNRQLPLRFAAGIFAFLGCLIIAAGVATAIDTGFTAQQGQGVVLTVLVGLGVVAVALIMQSLAYISQLLRAILEQTRLNGDIRKFTA